MEGSKIPINEEKDKDKDSDIIPKKKKISKKINKHDKRIRK